MKRVMIVAGIRPDWVRLSAIIKKLDASDQIELCVVNTGQHYDKMLSDVFFDELEIRKPDYNLGCGAPGKEHFELSGDITNSIIYLIRAENLNPDLILFLGDTNSVVCAVGLKKEGYKLGHIEAGMRSYDRRMLEEINRTVCDHCCDVHFVYHEDYKQHLLDEGIDTWGIWVVGNTIVEACNPIMEGLQSGGPSRRDQIIMDIHRPENFKDKARLAQIIQYANDYCHLYNVPVRMVSFGRMLRALDDFDIELGRIQLVPLMSYKQFLGAQYHSLFVFSDSGTAQEEAPLLGTPVVVPRDFTERPQSMDANCSFMLGMEQASFDESVRWLSEDSVYMKTDWLGDGQTSSRIVKIIEEVI
jgi:UDP-N-acetylglucosamine 2-epimerase (non-hydrolysing)